MTKVLERFKSQGLYEVDHVVGVWELRIDKVPVELKIKVTCGEGGMYLAEPNYRVKGASISLHLQNTAQEALEDTIRRFLASFNPLDMTPDDFKLEEDF